MGRHGVKGVYEVVKGFRRNVLCGQPCLLIRSPLDAVLSM